MKFHRYEKRIFQRTCKSPIKFCIPTQFHWNPVSSCLEIARKRNSDGWKTHGLTCLRKGTCWAITLVILYPSSGLIYSKRNEKNLSLSIVPCIQHKYRLVRPDGHRQPDGRTTPSRFHRRGIITQKIYLVISSNSADQFSEKAL